jgi:NAD+ kinase
MPELLFPAIGLIAKREDGVVRETLVQLADYLAARGHRLVLEVETAELLSDDTLPRTSLQTLPVQIDLAIIVGGDGTLLRAARVMAAHDVPLLGINLGRLGFLADIPSQRMLEALEQILRGELLEEQRFLLQVEIGNPESVRLASTALNDVVVHKWNVARLIELETHIQGRFVDVQRSDGLIVATPTGSTAYALSGGGPLMLPSLCAVVLVPICPHRLGNRPIVVDADSLIEIRVCGSTPAEHVRVTCDGQTLLAPRPDEPIRIWRAAHAVRLIHPKDHDHFDILRVKLGWGGQPH